MFMSLEYSNFLRRLQQYRVSMNMTQEQLSTVIGIGQSQLSKIEKGDLIISHRIIKQLDEIHWDVDYLFLGRESEMSSNMLLEYLKSLPDNKNIMKLAFGLLDTYLSEIKDADVKCDLFLLKTYVYESFDNSLLFYLRSYLRINQFVMADKLGVNVKKYRPMEKEKNEPDAEVLLRIYLLTGCRPSLFLNRECIEKNIIRNLSGRVSQEKQIEMIKILKKSQKLFE